MDPIVDNLKIQMIKFSDIATLRLMITEMRLSLKGIH